MATGIFLINKDDELIELSETRFKDENIFQELLGKYPNLLAGDLIDPDDPRRWILVTREMGIPDTEYTGNRWSVDHLFLDQDGIPTLVEVKKSNDTRIRREVIGQMLDYAANAIVYWPIEKIISAFERTCEEKGQNPEEVIQNFTTDDIEFFWTQVKTNLKAGKIRLIFLADEVPTELKRIVEFLNEQMDPAVVLALQIRQFKANGLQTLVPTLYGNTSEADKRKKASYTKGEQWTEERFFNELNKKCTPDQVEVGEKIFDWAKKNCDKLGFGHGKTIGSMIPYVFKNEDPFYPFAVWTTGYVELYFQWYTNRKPFDSQDMRLKMLDRFNHIEGINLRKEDINKRPSIKFELLREESKLQKFLEVIEWFIKKVKEEKH